MSKKTRLWMAGTVGVLMAGFMSVSVYALEEKDVIGTWYVNELSMGEGASFHPGAMGMEVTVDIKEDGKMETTSSVYGEEPEVDESEWKIENDKIVFSIEGEHVLQIGYLYAENTKGGKLINYEENIFQKEDEEYYLYRVPLLINGKGKMRKISKTRFLLEVIIRKLVNSWLFLFIVLVFIIAISYLR